MSSFNSQDVANSISSFATLNVKLDKRFRDAILKHMEKIGDSFQAKELVNILWGFEKLDSTLHFNLLRRIVDMQLNAQDVATTLYTISQIPFKILSKSSSENIELLKRALIVLQNKMLDLITRANHRYCQYIVRSCTNERIIDVFSNE